MTTNQATSRLLRSARRNSNLSQANLANRLGLSSAQSISNIERGVAPLPVSYVPALSRLLGVSRRTFLEALVSDARRFYKTQLGV